MAIKYGSSQPTAGRWSSTGITAIKYGSGTYKFIDTVPITFVQGGRSTVVNYAPGTTVNRPASLSGHTFLGWSTNTNGSNPVKSFVVTAAQTYYSVFSPDDALISTLTADHNGARSGPHSVSQYSTLKIVNNITQDYGTSFVSFRFVGLDEVADLGYEDRYGNTANTISFNNPGNGFYFYSENYNGLQTSKLYGTGGGNVVG